jgi:hypothetical protein
MAKKTICISFDYENDRNYRNLLSAWDANTNFTFVFNDKTPAEIQSNDYSRIKAVLTQKISSATRLLVIIGKYANIRDKNSFKIGEKNWQIWEIKKAKELNKKLVAVKLNKNYESPSELLGCGTSWAMGFSQDSILKALE